MRTEILIQVLLGAGALGHPRYILNNPLAHLHHHKRQGPAEINTYVENGRVVVDDIFKTTVYADGAPAPTPIVHAPVVTVVEGADPQTNEKLAESNGNNNQGNSHPQQAEKQYQPPPSPQELKEVVAQPTTTAPAPAQSTPAPQSNTQPPSSGGSGDGSPMSGTKSLLTTANYFRNLQGYGNFEYDDTLQGNAEKTNTDDGGNTMTHELNAGSFAQCIAEGSDTATAGDLTPFDLIYLGWLCEIPQGNLGTMCQTMIDTTHMSINYADPGHANILRTASYTKIGCGFQTATDGASYGGLWTCDFA